MRVVLLFATVSLSLALRCYDGTVSLDSNLKTKEKECGISSYCVQKINKKSGEMTRECSSFTDEHNMEEKCPMSGCHWQSSKETYCCCQFDLCNEWKSDGTEFKQGETVSATPVTTKPTATPMSMPTPTATRTLPTKSEKSNWRVEVPTTRAAPRRKNSEIELE